MTTENSNPATTAERETLARAVLKFLPADVVLSKEEELRPYQYGGLTAYQWLPLLVLLLLPREREQLRAILMLCKERQVPVVARGAGTGLSGGALPP